MGSNENARKAQREYMRAWRKANPDKVRKANRLYWERRAARQTQDKEVKQRENKGS